MAGSALFSSESDTKYVRNHFKKTTYEYKTSNRELTPTKIALRNVTSRNSHYRNYGIDRSAGTLRSEYHGRSGRFLAETCSNDDSSNPDVGRCFNFTNLNSDPNEVNANVNADILMPT